MSELRFQGRALVANSHAAVPHHELIPIDAGQPYRMPDRNEHLVVEGNHITALKALRPTHGSKAQCVWFSAPRSSGKESWIYRDVVNHPLFEEWLGERVADGDPVRHDKWCCMMLPRLRGLRELLAEDGVVLVSIDDDEVHYLRLLMDEVFGGRNFMATVLQEKRPRRGRSGKFATRRHEYIVIYAAHERCFRRALQSDLPSGTLQPATAARRATEILRLCSRNDSIVMDVYARTATIADAVLSLNHEDGGRRRFVLLVDHGDEADLVSAKARRMVHDRCGSAGAADGERAVRFGHYRVERSPRFDTIMKASRLPTYEELARYLFFVATGEEVVAGEMRPERWFVGSSRNYDIHLIYTDDPQSLQDVGLDWETAVTLARTNRRKIVFAPTTFLTQNFLDRSGIVLRPIPLELFELVWRVSQQRQDEHLPPSGIGKKSPVPPRRTPCARQ